MPFKRAWVFVLKGEMLQHNMIDAPVNSPSLPTDEGIVKTPKEFSDALTLDLTDEEIQQALRIIIAVSSKWQEVFRSRLRHVNFTIEDAMKLVDQFEDELVYELATKLDVLAHVDVAGVFEGKPPVVELVGALPSHSSAKHGLDHERKEWEVKKAKDKGQDFLGIDRIL